MKDKSVEINIKGVIPHDEVKFNNFSSRIRQIIEQNYLTGEKSLYGRVVSGSENENDFFQISLTTDEMIALDKLFIECADALSKNQDNEQLILAEKTEGYHPYFIEFYSENVGPRQRKVLNDYKGKWVNVTLCYLKKPSKLRGISIEGVLVYGASFTEQKNVILVVTREINVPEYLTKSFMWERLKQYKNPVTDNKIRSAWLATVENIQRIYCRIFNVGQGNCISLQLHDRQNDAKEIFFDLGYSILYHFKKPVQHVSCNNCFHEVDYINEFRKTLSFVAPEWIILSHWHADHLQGYNDVNENDLGSQKKNYDVYSHCFWIAPHLKYLKDMPNERIIKLAYYLMVNETIWMVDAKDCQEPVIMDNGRKIILWKGLLNNYNTLSSSEIVNDNGLLLQICNKFRGLKQNILFTGDCSFEQFPDNLRRQPCKVLVTPHHGSKHTKPDLRATENAQAIISVGNNSYHHPAPVHMAYLLEEGFQLDFTMGCNFLETELIFGNALDKFHRVLSKKNEEG